MTEDQIIEASRLWKAGYLVDDIARQFLVEPQRIYRLAHTDRDLFPYRSRERIPKRWRWPSMTSLDPVPSDRMRWTTESGAIVTLPRISLISCPRSV